jgi:hypothetical protein
MLLHIAIIFVWIAFSLAFYLMVGLACRNMRPAPFIIVLYAYVRSAIDGHSRWRWYAFLFVVTLIVTTACLRLGIFLASLGDVWSVAVTAATCLAVGYAAFIFVPMPEHVSRSKAILFRGAAIVVSLFAMCFYLFALVRFPNWLVRGIGTYALAVPPLVWFRSVRIRSATVLLAAAAVYDAMHVFVTGWMQEFMERIHYTTLVLRVPTECTLDANAMLSFGHGDVLGAGMVMVIAARAPERGHAATLIVSTLFGTGLGFVVATAITMVTHGLPALTVLGPCSCLGYAIGHLSSRSKRQTKTTPATG